MMYLSRDIAQRVVNRIAAGLARPISVTDATGRVLANTGHATIGAHLSSAARTIGTGNLCREVGDNDTILCLPITYGETTIGAVALHQIAGDEHDFHDIARISQTLAELIIHQAMVIEQLPQQRWIHNRFIYDLLHGMLHRSPEAMLEEAALLGIDLELPRIAVFIDLEPLIAQLAPGLATNTAPSLTRQLALDQAQDQLLEHARRTTRAHAGDVYSFIDDDRLVILAVVDLPDSDARCRQVIQATHQLLDEYLRVFGRAAGAGVGRYYSGWQALSASFKEAVFAYKTGTALQGHGRAYCVAELGLAGLLWNDDRASKVAAAQRLLQGLEDEPELWNTLEAFLRANLSPMHAAQSLHIHRHTLAYRLDKITRLTGRNPRLFEEAAQFQAALILQKLNSAPPAGSTNVQKDAPDTGAS